MRILQVCPYNWDTPGGVQLHVFDLATHLGRLGHEVLVMAPGCGRPAESWLRIVGRPLHVRFNGSRTSVCLSVRSLGVARAIMRRFQPDVVHVHEPLCPGVSMSATLLADAPVVGTFHANYAPSLASALYTAEARLLSRVWRRVDLGLAVSRAAADCIESRTGKRVRIIPNGIDVTWIARPPSNGRSASRRVLFVGRLDPRKGFPVAVQAFTALAARFPDLQFVVVGDGPDRHVLDRLPGDVRSRVVMRGPIRRAELPDEYRAADLLVAPALGSESFGIVLLEAMSVGLPVVASDISGYREVVRDGIEALLVPPADALALADAVGRVLTQPDLAARLGAGGLARARHFSWDTLATRVEAAYVEAMTAPGLAGAGLLENESDGCPI